MSSPTPGQLYTRENLIRNKKMNAKREVYIFRDITQREVGPRVPIDDSSPLIVLPAIEATLNVSRSVRLRIFFQRTPLRSAGGI